MNLLKPRRTPWDEESACPHGEALSLSCVKVNLPELPVGWPRSKDEIYLLGRWSVDPTRATSEDARQFMWAGLRVLRAEAKARGMSEDEVDRLLVCAFGIFHDAAESIWATLKHLQTRAQHESWAWGDCRIPAIPFGHRFNNLVAASGCRYTQTAFGSSTEHREGFMLARECEDTPARADPFVACAEDRPVPVKMQFNKPLTLLDPDAEILASFEP